jgi:hypothetical protein
MEYALGAVIVLLALGAVIYPLVRPRPGYKVLAGIDIEGEQALEMQRASIYCEIADLQFDHRVGKLAEADFLELRQGLLERAAELLAEDDRRRTALGHLVEREVARVRATGERREPIGAGVADGP